jgi:hypothetical protein
MGYQQCDLISIPQKANLTVHRMSEHDLVSVGLPRYQLRAWLQGPAHI